MMLLLYIIRLIHIITSIVNFFKRMNTGKFLKFRRSNFMAVLRQYCIFPIIYPFLSIKSSQRVEGGHERIEAKRI